MWAFTPSAGFVSITHAIITVGAISAVISNIAVQWKFNGKIDDTLDVFPCYGIVGMILNGVFSSHSLNAIATDELLVIFQLTIKRSNFGDFVWLYCSICYF